MTADFLGFPSPPDFTQYDDALAQCMAAHSKLVYSGHRDIADELTMAGYDRVIIFRSGGTNAYLARNARRNNAGARDWILAWRGTELDYQDIISDVTLFKRTSDYGNKWRAHGGFLSAMQAVWGSWWSPCPDKSHNGKVTRVGAPGVTEIIAEEANPDDRIFVTGHSLGGALAQLSAFYIHRDLEVKLAAVYTFGSPRVFDRGQAAHLDKSPFSHFRIVNGADLVPQVPPVLFGFKHTGRTVFITRDGTLKKDPTWCEIFWDVGWRQAVTVILAGALAVIGLQQFQAFTGMTISGFAWVLAAAAAGGLVFILLPKLLRLLPRRTHWCLISDHVMDAYRNGIETHKR